jgi:hypothetical protein
MRERGARRWHLSGLAGFAWPALALLLFAACLAGCGRVSLANLYTPTMTPSFTITFTPSQTGTLTETTTPVPPSQTPTDTPIPTSSYTATPAPTQTSTVTPGPSPTDTLTPTVTRTPTRTYIPTRTRTPSRTPTITYTPTITLTPTPPPPELFIARPGLLSRLVSPIQAEIYAIPGDDGLVRVELIGEDGRLIVRQALDFNRYKGRSIAFYPTIPFEINSAAETARLQVLTSDKFGRAIAIISTDVVLLKVGRNEIYDPLITQEPYIVRYPDPDQTISGGTLVIEGLIRPVNDSPVICEAIEENGVVLFTKQLVVAQPSGELSHTPFQLEIPYKVSGPTPVRLIFRQEGSRIPGSVALSSLTVTLEP